MKLPAKYANELILLLVMILIGGFITLKTTKKFFPEDEDAGAKIGATILAEAQGGNSTSALILGTPKHAEFIGGAQGILEASDLTVETITAGPVEIREALEKLNPDSQTFVACVQEVADWGVLTNFQKKNPRALKVFAPDPVNRSPFLEKSNFLNLADRTATIGIIAIGMTMIIITAGIDLSVGSLVALAAVVSSWLLAERFGGTDATTGSVILSCVAAVFLCGAIGATSGSLVTFVGVPPFIVTLAFMMVARGLAFIVSKNESISNTPEAFAVIGQKTVAGIPFPALLSIGLFVVFHVLMTRTTLGRYIYAVGGNREAARLSGVPVSRVLLFVYTATGILAGVVGIITASRFGTGKATFGNMMELDVIAAVVIGGTSLFGGEGRMVGTFIGSLLIVVIRNGMNLLNVDPNEQPVVLGLVILGAVIVDTIGKRRRGRI